MTFSFPYQTRRFLQNRTGFGVAGDSTITANNLFNVSKDLDSITDAINQMSPLLPTANEKAGMDAANNPSSTNPFATISDLGSSFISSINNVGKDVTLTVTAGALSANLTSILISQFTNDVPYLTSVPANFITSITDTATIDLNVSAGVLTANFINAAGYITASSASALTNKTGNISMWTNDAGYLTSATIPLTANQIAVGSGGGFLSSSSSLTFSSGVLGVSGRIDTGYVQFTEFSSVSTPSAGVGAYWSKSDGHAWYTNSVGANFDLCQGNFYSLASATAISGAALATTSLTFASGVTAANSVPIYAVLKYNSGTLGISVVRIKTSAGYISPAQALATLTSSDDTYMIPLNGAASNTGSFQIEVTTASLAASTFNCYIYGITKP